MTSPLRASITTPAAPMARKVAIAPRQLLGQNVLDTQIEAQLQRLGGGAQNVVEGLFDAGEALVVDAGETDHVGRQGAVRIKAPMLALEIESGNAKPVDRMLLARRQIALKPDEGTLAGQLGGKAGRTGIGQERRPVVPRPPRDRGRAVDSHRARLSALWLPARCRCGRRCRRGRSPGRRPRGCGRSRARDGRSSCPGRRGASR